VRVSGPALFVFGFVGGVALWVVCMIIWDAFLDWLEEREFNRRDSRGGPFL
jgi:hypothetical protein